MTSSPTPGLRATVRQALLIVLTFVTVGMTYQAGHRLGMSTIVSTRHAYYSLPYAVSSRVFGTRGYVILREVAELFIRTHPHITNDTLARATTLTPSRDRLMFFPGDDKGDADFAILAFRVFGMHVESLYYLWFALYLAGIVAFIVVFWRSEARLAALSLLTFAVYSAFFALPLTFELGTIDNPRAFGAISLVAVLHLSFAMIDRDRLTATRLAAVALQSALIALSVDVRTTEWWQVLAIAGVATWLLARARVSVATLWPCAVLIVALAGLDVYQRLAVDKVYEESQLRHRIFWHNVGIGFALNPTLARKYSLIIDDMPMIQLVRRRLVETNRANELDLVFRPAGLEDYQFSGFAKDFVRYEKVAREVVVSIMWNNKLETVRTFIVDKPRVLVMQFAWAMGYQGYSIDELYLGGQIGALVPERDRPEKSIYLDLFRPWILGGFVATVLLGSMARRRREYVQLAILSLWMCAVSLLPVMAAYPIISAIGVALVTTPFCALALAAWLVATGAALAGRQAPAFAPAVRIP